MYVCVCVHVRLCNSKLKRDKAEEVWQQENQMWSLPENTDKDDKKNWTEGDFSHHIS